MQVSIATAEDSADIFSWRNDPHSRNMFFDGSEIAMSDHERWFREALGSDRMTFFIGRSDNTKVGVCRFDIDENGDSADVSINLNPLERGKGKASQFLRIAMQRFIETFDGNIYARIKKINIQSLKLFDGVGFYDLELRDDYVVKFFPKRNLSFLPVDERVSREIYQLLGERRHNISHRRLPSFEEHMEFIRSKPYRYWFLVVDEEPIGTFYVQPDNSIGLNLSDVRSEWIAEIISFIKLNFIPAKAVPSRVPDYFYVNIATSNRHMIEEIEKLNLEPLQVSYKLSPNRE
ncbi:GNAT family N-acetyltransferase [Thalassospira sp.]|uniref:GNAT family N-acetyltransferase n=1 Tax=Thalassospira sp. TaxID=1912094 RepID=UPI003AA7ECF8